MAKSERICCVFSKVYSLKEHNKCYLRGSSNDISALLEKNELKNVTRYRNQNKCRSLK